MKIALLTIQYAHNYGAVLQAYALKTFLEKNGHTVRVIHYIPPCDEKKYGEKLRNDVGKKYALRHLAFGEWFAGWKTSVYGQQEWQRRRENFISFIEKYLLDGRSYEDRVYEEDDFLCDAELLLCGSDQIWNPYIVGANNPMYFGANVKKIRKATYAASMGRVIPFADSAEVISWLQELNGISVREKELKEYLEKDCCLENVQVVVDPCLLMEGEDFMSLIPEQKLENSAFHCAYFISESGVLKKCFRGITEIQGLPVVEIHWKRQFDTKNQNQQNSLGVGEFLWHIKNSTTVYTDSFHGVVFSLLFHKDFWAIGKGNNRVAGLLEQVGLSNRLVDSLEEINCGETIDWEHVDDMLDQLKAGSLEYLKRITNA